MADPNGRSVFGMQAESDGGLEGFIGRVVNGMMHSGGSPYPEAPYAGPMTWRRMKRDPVVALARAITLYPILAAKWGIVTDGDGVPDEWVNYTRGTYFPIRNTLLKQYAFSLDFGWRVMERVIRLEDGYQVPGFKPLRPELTDILVNRDTGVLEGVRQGMKKADVTQIVFHTNDIEDDDYRGQSRLENIREEAWWPSLCLARNVQRLENNKLVGVMPIWYYDPTPRTDSDGNAVDPEKEAEIGLRNLQRAVGLAIPNLVTANMTLAEIAEASKVARNKIDVIQFPEASGAIDALMNRAKYYDTQKMRGYLKPERMALEGTFGTKAEAETHADIGMADSSQLHGEWTETTNKQSLDRDLELNFGKDAPRKVRLVAGPISDTDKVFFRSLITNLLTNPSVADLMLMAMDKDAMLDKGDIPKSAETVDFDKLQAELEKRRGKAADISQQQKDQLSKFAASITGGTKYAFGGYNHGCNQYGCGVTGSSRDPKERANSAKVARSKAAHVYVGKDIQRYSEEHNEPILAKGLTSGSQKALSLRDNEPVDAVVTEGGRISHGVELKTMVVGNNDKITMKADALERKKNWQKENKAPYSTVVFDDRKVYNSGGNGKHDDSQRTIYYKRGAGSFRVGSMHQCKDMAELRKLLKTPDKELPPAAQAPKGWPRVRTKK